MLQQQSTWDLARIGYKSLESVRTKVFDFNGVAVRVQFNPGRIKSSLARIDKKSIQERPCFLCDSNLPPEQKGILCRDEFLLLVNPYPIFPEHFTVAHTTHTPQQIVPHVAAYIDLVRDLAPEFALLYNGPRAGASAPDHMHFQAGYRASLPVVDEYLTAHARFGRLLANNGDVRVFSVDRYTPSFIAFEATSPQALARAILTFINVMQEHTEGKDEPMMNLVSWFDDSEWKMVVFPRAKHRPDRFYEKGERRITLSPAAIDLAGLATIPVEADFERIQAADLEAIFDEVILSPDLFREVTRTLAEKLER